MTQHFRLFVISFKNSGSDHTIDSFDSYYMPLRENQKFQFINWQLPFFDQPVKKKQKPYEKLITMSRNGDYTTGSLLDYFYHQKYYKLITIDLLRQINTIIPRQVDIIGILGEHDGAMMSSIA